MNLRVGLLLLAAALGGAGCGANQDAGTPKERATLGTGTGDRESGVHRSMDLKTAYPKKPAPTGQTR